MTALAATRAGSKGGVAVRGFVSDSSSVKPDVAPSAMARLDEMRHTRTGDRRVSTKVRPGLSRYARIAWSLVRGLRLAATGPHGQCTDLGIANRLDVACATLKDWTSPEGVTLPRADAMVTLLCDPAIAPPDARRAALEVLAAAAGFAVVAKNSVSLDSAPLAIQMLQVEIAMGEMARMLEVASRANSLGGSRISASEAAEMLPNAREILREVSEMVETLRAKAEGGGA
jgi:hypothetical protein